MLNKADSAENRAARAGDAPAQRDYMIEVRCTMLVSAGDRTLAREHVSAQLRKTGLFEEVEIVSTEEN